MMSSTAVPIVTLGTPGAVLLILLGLFLRHMRKRANRHPMKGQRERNIDEIRREGPDDRR